MSTICGMCKLSRVRCTLMYLVEEYRGSMFMFLFSPCRIFLMENWSDTCAPSMGIVHCLGIMDLLEFLHFRRILGIFMGHWVKDAADNTLWSCSINNFIHFHNVQIVHDLLWWHLHTYVGNVARTSDGMAQG